MSTEPEGGTEIKRHTVADRVNLDISIRSGMLFTLKMTALSVIMKPRQPAGAKPDQSIIEKLTAKILAEEDNIHHPVWYFILKLRGSWSE